MRRIAESLVHEHRLGAEEYRTLLSDCDSQTFNYMRQEAARTAHKRFGFGVYVRGLVEISSYCRNNCHYCGLRRENSQIERYRLSPEEILSACQEGYRLGFRTFVLQGGEDGFFSDNRLIPLVKEIRQRFPEAALTLSLGERSAASYQALFDAGANRYLLRHEAASPSLYAALHPAEMSYTRRIESLETLQRIGYQTGMGMMIGAPGQTIDHLVEDLLLLERMRPQMVGIGPFLPHHDTPYGKMPAGSLTMTLKLLAIIRLMLPDALIPATTALATLSSEGRKAGILSGANVVMPNLSPPEVRSKYAIYDHKSAFGSEAAEGIRLLEKELVEIGYHIDFGRGDYKPDKTL